MRGFATNQRLWENGREREVTTMDSRGAPWAFKLCGV